MKVKIAKEEWYPVYTEKNGSNYPDYVIQVPDELFMRWKRAQIEFEDIQLEIALLVEKQSTIVVGE